MRSSPDAEEISEFTEKEMEKAMKRMKRHNGHCMDGITSDIIKHGMAGGVWGGGGGGRGKGFPTRMVYLKHDI